MSILSTIHPELYRELDEIIALCNESGITDPDMQSRMIRHALDAFLREKELPAI